MISSGSDSSSITIKLFNIQLKTPCRMFNKLFCRSQYMMCTHQNGALKIGGHPSEQQPSHQTGDGGKDESSTQSPGHREVISWTGSVHRDPGQITTVTWGRRRDHIHRSLMDSNGLSFQHKIWKDCVCLYLERAAPCRSISATVSLNNPPSGSSSPGPAPPGWWADPWAGTAGRPAPSRTAPSYVPPPAHGHTDSWRSNRLSHSLV